MKRHCIETNAAGVISRKADGPRAPLCPEPVNPNLRATLDEALGFLSRAESYASAVASLLFDDALLESPAPGSNSVEGMAGNLCVRLACLCGYLATIQLKVGEQNL